MIQFQVLKRTYDTIASAITKGQEPMEELIVVRRYLHEICADNGAAFTYTPAQEGADESTATGLSPDQVRYILEDFGPGIIKKLCRERSRDDQYLEICGGVLEGFLNLMMTELKRGNFNQEFLFACRSMFDFDCTLHKFNFRIPEETLQKLFTQGSGQSWRHELKVGDNADILLHYLDRTGSSRGSGWVKAKVSGVDEDRLLFVYENQPKEADRVLDRWSIEISPYETKTKEIWEWKNTLKVDDNVDLQDDTFKWLKGTVLKIEEEMDDDRVFPMATIGLRVYTSTGQRHDERGNYEGWSDRFDEKVPLYSARIVKFMTLSQKQSSDDDDLDETLDELMAPAEGNSRVWAVPRPRKCTSSEYIRHISHFCEKGGLELILDVIENTESSDKTDGFNLCVLAILLSLISLPAQVYHKQVIVDFAPRLIELSKKRLLNSPDRALRDVRREHIEAIVKAVESLSKRLVEKGQNESESEVLKLEVSLLCLNSSYMERRIQGIRDLNAIIKAHRINSSKVTGKFLVEWMQTNGVLEVLFDFKKTHLQLIQRCDEVLKLLLQEDVLSEQLLQQLWNLTKTDLRLEIYKIISDCVFYFKQKHLDFLFERIKNDIPVEKLDMDEFNCLSQLGMYAKDKESGFQEKIVDFFWDIIVSSSTKNIELIESCTSKYREVVKYWTIEQKQVIFQRLVKSLGDKSTPSVPTIKLLKGLIKDQSERYNYSATSNSGYMGTYPQNTGYYPGIGGDPTNGTSPLRSKPSDGSVESEKDEEATTEKKEINLQTVLTDLIQDDNLLSTILEDLAIYCKSANSWISSLNEEQQATAKLDRNKMYVQGAPYSHHEEIDERIEFLKYFASQSDSFCLQKKELGVIYDLLVTQSCIETDQQEFLNWCKSSCESQSAKSAILDLGQVGEFFTQKIACKEFDVKNLSSVGFGFLQFYFISLNEKEGNLERQFQTQQAQQQKSSYPGYSNETRKWTTSYSWTGNSTSSTNQEKGKVDKTPQFTLQKEPSQLKEKDMLWTLVLECENQEVVPLVIDFFIKAHLSLNDDLKSKKIEILQDLIKQCMEILKKEDGNTASRSKRVIEILKNLVHETEVKGTGDVQPHGALHLGEPLEGLTVKNRATLKGGDLLVQAFSNTTLWDLRKQIASTLDLAPRNIQLSLGSGYNLTDLKDIDNGKTLHTIGIQGGQVMTAQKISIEEQIPHAILIGPDNELTSGARRIFTEWYEMFCNAEGQFTRDSTAQFIQGCCGDLPAQNDNRISGLFQTYDGNNDGIIEKEEFLQFYKACCKAEKISTVRENLKAFNVRPDLKKYSEVGEEAATSVEELPRWFISKDQDHFDLLMSLLDGGDRSVAEEAWELIQMLATNQSLYRRVLQLEIAKQDGSSNIKWAKFFDRTSPYKLLYTLQIVQAVLEDGSSDSRRAIVLNSDNFPSSKFAKIKENNDENLAMSKQNSSSTSQITGSELEDSQLRTQWAEEFLKQGGFQHIIQEFMNCTISKSNAHSNSGIEQQIELKYIAFMLHLLRSFTMAAFSTIDLDTYKIATLARRSSSTRGNDTTEAEQSKNHIGEEGTNFQQLKTLLAGPLGLNVTESVDYSALQKKVVEVTSLILKKESLIFEDKLILENALNLWTGCLLHRTELFKEFTELKSEEVNSDNLLLSGLLYCPYEGVRQEFKDSLEALCQKSDNVPAPRPLDHILILLSTNFSLISEYPCKQYFELFCELLDKHFLEVKLSSKGFDSIIDQEALLSSVIDKIRQENKKAQNARAEGAANQQDQNEQKEAASLFQGLIQLAGKILDNCQDQPAQKHQYQDQDQNLQQQRGLVDEIFTKYLFPTVFLRNQSQKSSVLTISQVIDSRMEKKQSFSGIDSKNSAYKLLISLLKRDPSLMAFFLENCMAPLLSFIERTETWNYTPPSSTERNQDYVGIRNLGCICYMNSMLQQFFMIPAFRYNILSVDDGVPEDMQDFKGGKVDDSMLHQLQKLMSNLEISERSDYNPFEFCFSFKEFDGTPTNTSEQKDAQEFLNLIFDRVENGLKNTPQKYLLQSVFGGKTCSQLVCKECGKVKNREEDFYNLSLTVKDIKGMHESLAKLVEGEVISDYECSGCKKKVDVSKRTLISQTPNVLIIHLQRIIFNFDTFQNDKINQHFEFPQTLDLKPYSYYEVMGKEGLIPKEKAGGEEGEKGEEDDRNAEKDQESNQKPKENENEEEDDNKVPDEEDCFEYKLVGCTVHSGTAHSGHYWAYINTARGKEEPADTSDQAWGEASDDKWMEFNDSTVRDFQYSKLKEECFGGESSNSGGFGLSSLDGWGLGGGRSYGKSGYMLFYERRKKKPLRILVQDKQSEQELKEGEKKEEEILEVDFQEMVQPNEVPNPIFKKVLDENTKFGFENDVYSTEFFDFILGTLKTVLAMEGEGPEVQALREKAIDLGSKSTLEIVARAFNNACIDDHVKILAKIMQKDQSGSLCRRFLQNQYDNDQFDYLFACLLECPDTRARSNSAFLIKYVLVQMKILEKDNLFEVEEFETEDDQGKKVSNQRYKALSTRFITKAMSLLNTRVAKNWSRFDQFHDVLYNFALADICDVEPTDSKETEVKQFDLNSQAARIGLEFFFQANFVEKACDFMLGKKSPLCQPDEKRQELGGAYTHPDFSSLIRLMTQMITDEKLLEKYPLSELSKQMILHHDLLKTMLGSATASKQFGQCLANMCKDNAKLTKKVSKVFLRSIEQAHLDTVNGYLKALKPFLKSNDSLKLQKLEWVFGIPEVVYRKVYGETKCKFGVELVDKINEESVNFSSPILYGSSDESLIAQIIKCKDRFDVQCISCLKELLSLMRKDPVIAKFLYHLPSFTYQGARFTDWFRPYLEEQSQDPMRQSNSTNQYLRNKYQLTTKALAHLDALEPVFAEFQRAQLEEIEKAKQGQNQFTGLAEEWAGYNGTELLKHFPPQLIIGKQMNNDREVFLNDENPHVKVQIFELECEHAYSSPTGLFNLQLPQIEVRTSLYQTQSYKQYKRASAVEDSKQENADLDMEQDKNPQGAEIDDDKQTQQTEVDVSQTKEWDQSKKVGPIIFKVVLTNKSSYDDLKVWYKLSVDTKDSSDINVNLPISMRKTYLNGNTQMKIIELLVKVDPSKDYFIKDLDKIKIDLEVTQKNLVTSYQDSRGTGPKQVTYAIQHSSSIGVGDSSINDQDVRDDEGLDDDQAYSNFQARPQYDGYTGTAEGIQQEEHLVGLLLQNTNKDDGDNDSTTAVGNGYDQKDDMVEEQGGYTKCSCGQLLAPDDFTCESCGEYIGGVN